jgi:hypothetical protein
MPPQRATVAPMESRFVERAGLLTWVGLALVGIGPSVLLVTTWVVYLNDTSLGLWAGYGNEPWTSLGIVVTLAGAVVAQLAASARVLARGDWLRRVLVVPLALVPGAWWATALGVVPFPRFTRNDPIEFAYTLPVAAAVMLLLPAVVAAVLAFLPIRHDTRVTFAPVPRPSNQEHG